MRLKRRMLEQRPSRVKGRAQTSPSEAPAGHGRHVYVCADAPSPAVSEPRDLRRRSRRVPVDTEIAMRKAGGFGFQLSALDMSAGGCKVELIESVAVDERVIARLPQLAPMGAEVRWVAGGNAGLRFQSEIHPAVFDHWMAGLRTKG